MGFIIGLVIGIVLGKFSDQIIAKIKELIAKKNTPPAA